MAVHKCEAGALPTELRSRNQSNGLYFISWALRRTVCFSSEFPGTGAILNKSRPVVPLAVPGLHCVMKAGLGPAMKRLSRRRHRIHSAIFFVFFFFFGGSGAGASASARSARSTTLLRSFSFLWRLWRDLSPFNCDISWPHVVTSSYRLQ